MSANIIPDLYVGLAPWLALALIFLGRNPHLSRTRIMVSLVLALFLLWIPVGGWHLFSWIRMLEPNPSLTLTALLAITLYQRISRKKLFRRDDWNAAWIVGVILALLLYPMGLGLTAVDPYSWGWGPSLPVLIAVMAAILLLRGNRFGIVLLVPFIGFLAGLQESTNFWDAVLDPMYAIFSLVAVACRILIRGGRSSVSSAAPASPSGRDCG